MSFICRPISNALDTLSIHVNRIRAPWRGRLVVGVAITISFAAAEGAGEISHALNSVDDPRGSATTLTMIGAAVVTFGLIWRRFGWLAHPRVISPMPPKAVVLRLVDEITNQDLPEFYREETRTLVREIIDVRIGPYEQIRVAAIHDCPLDSCSIHNFKDVRAAVFAKLGERDNENFDPPTLLRPLVADSNDEEAG